MVIFGIMPRWLMTLQVCPLRSKITIYGGFLGLCSNLNPWWHGTDKGDFLKKPHTVKIWTAKSSHVIMGKTVIPSWTKRDPIIYAVFSRSKWERPFSLSKTCYFGVRFVYQLYGPNNRYAIHTGHVYFESVSTNEWPITIDKALQKEIY